MLEPAAQPPASKRVPVQTAEIAPAPQPIQEVESPEARAMKYRNDLALQQRQSFEQDLAQARLVAGADARASAIRRRYWGDRFQWAMTGGVVVAGLWFLGKWLGKGKRK